MRFLADCDRCRSARRAVDAPMLEAAEVTLRLAGWTEHVVTGREFQWWCPACKPPATTATVVVHEAPRLPMLLLNRIKGAFHDLATDLRLRSWRTDYKRNKRGELVIALIIDDRQGLFEAKEPPKAGG